MEVVLLTPIPRYTQGYGTVGEPIFRYFARKFYINTAVQSRYYHGIIHILTIKITYMNIKACICSELVQCKNV